LSAGDRPITRLWYGDSPWVWLLSPLAALFAGASALRRQLYRFGVWRAIDVGRPVVVVGNLTVGGTGKTPVTLWFAEQLKARGRRPGIVSRGYRGRLGPRPVHVRGDSDPAVVGDEPLLMERRQVCPVVVHPDRVAAARMLIEMDCDIIVADDGLQHYRLARQYEIAVVDGRRGFGNGRLLPAGPLREPVSRLARVDRILVQREPGADAVLPQSLPEGVPYGSFALLAEVARNVRDARAMPLTAFRGRTVHAVAGIGHPARFFRLLQGHGIEVIPHAHPDHAALAERHLRFEDDCDVLLTEKDAVRCRDIAPDNCWYVPVDVAFDEGEPSEWVGTMLRDVEGRPARSVA
jgi:tetraacyldisaccharide 4'-kinase